MTRLNDFLSNIEAGNPTPTTCGRYYKQTFKDCSILLNQDNSGVVCGVIFSKLKLVIWASDISWRGGHGYNKWARYHGNDVFTLPLNDTDSTFKENIADSSLLGVLDNLVYVKIGATPLAIIPDSEFNAHRFMLSALSVNVPNHNKLFGVVVPYNLGLTNVMEYLLQPSREGAEFHRGSWVKNEGELPPEIDDITLMPMKDIKNRTKFIKAIKNNYFVDESWFDPFKILANKHSGYTELPDYLKRSTLRYLDGNTLIGEQSYFDKDSKKALTVFDNVWHTLLIPELPVYKVHP